MHYLGGKFRQGKQIAQIISPHLYSGCTYIEPFCGALGSAYHVAKVAPVSTKFVLSDVHEPLITMWKALFSGWVPPNIDKSLHEKYLKGPRDPKDPMTAYMGFGMSHIGDYYHWFSGKPEVLKRSCDANINLLKTFDIKIECCSYTKYAGIQGSIFYLDPPYEKRTELGKLKFNSLEFWDFTRELSKDNKVFVTGFDFPDDFTSIYSWGDTISPQNKLNKVDERLVIHESAEKWYYI